MEQLGSVIGGFTKNPARSKLRNRLPYLSVANVYANELRLGHIEYVGVRDTELAKLLLHRGDLLIVEGNGSKDQIGRVAVWDGSIDPCVHQNHLIKVRLIEPSMSNWVSRWLQSPLGRHQVERVASSTSGLYTLSVKKVGNLPVPLPPLAEQQRIVAEVERRLSVIEEMEKIVDANLQRASRLRQSILERAFSGRFIKSSVIDKSVSKIKETSPASRRHFLRALLSAEIVHQLHAEPTFGQIKHQKIFHLCEHIAEITDLDVRYHRDAAGPYDNRLIYANEAELKRQKWYESYSRKKVGHGYRALAKAGGHEKYLERYWPEKLETNRRLIRLMRHWDTERCEIFATAYAAWNDLLLWEKEVSDDAILQEVLYRWHDSKQRIPEARWRKALEWMRKEGFVPTGFGKPTAAASRP
ncbi:MAG TPA: hypothetical protein VK648_00275 [Gemmatimonadaceae bacterium]|nr:hypothetical protein [Gemmatimonadaceae bacterium]